MTYHQFKKLWLDQQHNPATGYDHDQESVIVQAYIEHLEGKVEELEKKCKKWQSRAEENLEGAYRDCDVENIRLRWYMEDNNK